MYFYSLLYKIEWFIDFFATNNIDNLTCVIIHEISHVWLFMIISHVSIIMKRIRVHCSIFVGQ